MPCSLHKYWLNKCNRVFAHQFIEHYRKTQVFLVCNFLEPSSGFPSSENSSSLTLLTVHSHSTFLFPQFPLLLLNLWSIDHQHQHQLGWLEMQTLGTIPNLLHLNLYIFLKPQKFISASPFWNNDITHFHCTVQLTVYMSGFSREWKTPWNQVFVHLDLPVCLPALTSLPLQLLALGSGPDLAQIHQISLHYLYSSQFKSPGFCLISKIKSPLPFSVW